MQRLIDENLTLKQEKSQAERQIVTLSSQIDALVQQVQQAKLAKNPFSAQRPGVQSSLNHKISSAPGSDLTLTHGSSDL